MSDSENLSEEMWEENSIDSGGFSEISSPESSSDDNSDHIEVAEEDVNFIRGAEPYRFEPQARPPRRMVEQDARDDDQPVQPPACNNDRLTQRSYAILMSLMNPLQQSVLYILTLYLSHFRSKLTPKRINSQQSIPLFISLFNCLNFFTA